MKVQSFCNFMLAGVSLTDFGLKIPSPFTSLKLSNAQITSMTSWELTVNITGDDTKGVNSAAFEALLYSAAQSAYEYKNASGIPVSFMFGWLDEFGNVRDYISYQGFTLQFSVSANGRFLTYTVKGYASTAIKSHMPVLNIPALSGIVQPSAVVESIAKAVKADIYYDLDIDHSDEPTLVQHGHLTTSFTKYVGGYHSATDNFDDFPGLLTLSKSYNGSRDAGGIKYPYRKLSTIVNNANGSISKYLKKSIVDNTVQSTAFSFWIDEPTMTKRGVIHYKSNAGLLSRNDYSTLRYGTSNTNIISLSGNYDGVAYNMTDLNFKNLGFAVDGTGDTVVDANNVVNSWSSSLADTFQTANIINDINALASQFSNNFNVTIPGNVSTFGVAQPVNLLVVSGNSISPITGVYNITGVSHDISVMFTTTLTLQRLQMSSANQVASGQGITIGGSTQYSTSAYNTTSNIKSTGKVDFGELYPTFLDM